MLAFLVLVAFSLFDETRGAFVAIPMTVKTTMRLSPRSVVLFQATESETQDKKEAVSSSTPAPLVVTPKTNPEETTLSFVDGIQQGFQTSLRIMSESQAQGYGIKQIMANVLAGDYDETEMNAKIDAYIQNSPVVMFTWQRSPSCVQAVDTFRAMGILDQVQIVRLDDPWSEGNPVRAQIGKRVGRSSVPMIFIGGAYVGGFDGGLASSSSKAPGIQTMAFQGTLRPALEAAGIKLPAATTEIGPSS
jgi:glutaredoxin-related protein